MTIAEETKQYAQMLMASFNSFNGRAPFILAVIDPESRQLMMLSNATDRAELNALLKAILSTAMNKEPDQTEDIPRRLNEA